jgi:DNA-directed RNA polymerase specialized sigma24 family protein
MAIIFCEDVWRIIARLPAECRLVMVLSRLEGFSCEVLSHMADLRLDVVKSAIDQGNRLISRELLKSREQIRASM